jgi:hypothetical protein
MVAGTGCGSDGDGEGKSGSGHPAFQGDPALDGLKPGDSLKYPDLDACS